MARKRSSNGSGGSTRPNTGNFGGFKGFVDLPLTDAIRDELSVAMEQGALNLIEFLVTVAQDGYKFSVTFNPGLKSFIATLTGRDGSGDNEGYALSGFGTTVEQALYSLYGKHVMIAHWGDWHSEGRALQRELPEMR